MTDGLTVWLQALTAASTDWEGQSGVLGEARTSVWDAQQLASSLGEGVSARVTTFFDDWVTELTTLRDDAHAISDQLSETATTYQLGDDAVEEAMAALLPWDQRTLDPEAA